MKRSIVFKPVAIFLGMVLGTGATGLILGFGVGFLAASLMKNQLEGWGALAGAAMGLFLGYPLGVIGGQIIISKLVHYRGSIWLGILGVILGFGLTVGLTYVFHINVDSNILIPVFFALTPLLGTAGYHLGRRESRAPAQSE